jgi:hypothetical protein
MPLALSGAGDHMIKTIGAAVGAALVILFLATVASRLASPADGSITQASALRR